MPKLFAPNIDTTGRVVRGMVALALFAGAWFGARYHWLVHAILALAGAFVLFEALRGWCGLRACGIKTKL